MVNFGEDADCESAVFFRPFLPPSYFLELEILGGFARLAPAPPVLYARNKSRLSRASGERRGRGRLTAHPNNGKEILLSDVLHRNIYNLTQQWHPGECAGHARLESPSP